MHWIDGGDSTITVAFNLNHKDPLFKAIFHDRGFRIAMSHAINREAINQVIFKNIGQTSQLSPSHISAYYDSEYARAYTAHNPDRANQFLDDMGLAERNEERVRLRPDGRPLILQIERVVDENEQIRLFKEIIEINRQNLWVIDSVVGIPKLFIVQSNLWNVPEVAVAS